MPIIVDAMGGDHAPEEIVRGAIRARRSFGHEIVLVGREPEIRAVSDDLEGISVVHAEDVIGMDEHPAQALKRKKNNSLSVAVRLAKESPGSAVLSAGSTGAFMAASLFGFRRLPGVERPAIAGILPSDTGRPCMVADIGANVDCKPSQLRQFAILCSAYSSLMFQVENPRVGLLNIGTEDTKGNELCQKTHLELSEVEDIDFIGNVEPEAVYSGEVDVVVSDGFAGNIFLKSSEAISNIFYEALGPVLHQAKDMPPVVQKALASLARFSTKHKDLAAAPLLGINGVAIIAHGSVDAATVELAVDLAHRAAESGYLARLQERFQKAASDA